MDSAAQLALLTKAKLVFESHDTFLSFPALTPISYTPDELTFGPAPSTQQMSTFCELCRFMNVLPPGVVFQPSMDTFLWDILQDVLNTAQVAQGTLTPRQASQLQAARAFLYVQTAQGLQTDSPQAIAYDQYEHAFLQATQDYKNQQLTAQASTDPNVQSQWQSTLEPKLRAAVQAAESDWEQKGFKAQVEQARTVEQNCAAQSPQLRWQAWSALFDPKLDLLTDATTNLVFAPTAFSPSNVLDQANWPTFTIAGSEIAQLVSQAPQELSNVLDTTSTTSNIQSLSFQYCSVVLSRPWLQPDLFSARFWRFVDPSMQLSDGANPPQGRWPAFITGLVFARNIVEQQPAATGGSQSQPVRTFPPIALRAGALPPPTLVAPVSPLRPPVDPAVAAQNRLAVFARLGASTFQSLPASTPEPVVASPASAFLVHSAAATSMAPRFTLAGTISPLPPPAPASQPAAPPPAPASDPHVSVLAFICKRLPKSPDPDPSLAW